MSPPSRAGKVGLRRVDAALDAMLQYGFPRRFIRSTISELLKVYGAEGWVFIEDSSYRLLVETLLQKQEESKDEDCPESLRDEELNGVEGDNTQFAGCSSEPPEPEVTKNVKVTSPSIDIGKEQLRPVKMEVCPVKMAVEGEPMSGPIDKFSATNINNSSTQTSLHTNNMLCITDDVNKEGYSRNDKLIMKIPEENIPLQVRRCKKEQIEGKESSEKPLLTSANNLIKLKTKLDSPSPSSGLYPKPVIPVISEKNHMRVSRSTTDNTNFSEANDRKIKKDADNVRREISKSFSCKNDGTSMSAHIIKIVPSRVNFTNPVLPANQNKSKMEQMDQHSMHFASGIDRKMGKEGDLVNNIKVKKEMELEGCHGQRETAHTSTSLPVSANKVKKEQMEWGSVNLKESIERRKMDREGDFFMGVCGESNLSHRGGDAPKKAEKNCLSVEPTIDGHTRNAWERTNVEEKQEQRKQDRVELKTEDKMEQRRSRWQKMASRMGYTQRRSDGIPANMERGRDFGMVTDDVERRRWEVSRIGAILEAGREGHGVMVGGTEHGYRGWDGMGNRVELGRRERDRTEDNPRYSQRGDGGQNRWDKEARCEKRDGRSKRNEHDFSHRDNTLRKEINSFRWRSPEQGRDEDENSGWGSWGDKYIPKNSKVGKKEEEIGPCGATPVTNYSTSQICEFVGQCEASHKDDGHKCQPLQPGKKHEHKSAIEVDGDCGAGGHSVGDGAGGAGGVSAGVGVSVGGAGGDVVKEKVEKHVNRAFEPCRGWIGCSPYRDSQKEETPLGGVNGEEKKAEGSQRPCHGELVRSVPAVLEDQIRDLVKGRVSRKLGKKRALWDE